MASFLKELWLQEWLSPSDKSIDAGTVIINIGFQKEVPKVFWKKKKQQELSDGAIEGIIREYSDVLKAVIATHLPRRMRRAMDKGNKGWGSLSPAQRKAQIQETRQQGVGPWLEETTQETYEQIASFVADAAVLEQELRGALATFKKERNIR